MRIGVDLDNTIVCYDALFHRLGRCPDTVPINKDAVRQYIRSRFGEEEWIRLQGQAYGPHMREARAFEGALETINSWCAAGIFVAIVSHKTSVPAAGPAFDLHAASMDWLKKWNVVGNQNACVPEERVWFEQTREAKLRRIDSLRLDAFVDDLVEVFEEPGFPTGPMRLLLCENDDRFVPEGIIRVPSWRELGERLNPLMT